MNLPGLFAQAAPVAQAAAGGKQDYTIFLMLAVFVIFYLILILPESRRRKKLKEQLKALKIGDRVITNSGVYGTIDFINEPTGTVYIRSLDAKIEVAKESIAGVVNPNADKK